MDVKNIFRFIPVTVTVQAVIISIKMMSVLKLHSPFRWNVLIAVLQNIALKTNVTSFDCKSFNAVSGN